MDREKIPRKETFIWRKLPGGAIEVEGCATHFLNPMGAQIWELIDERNRVADILEIFLEKNRSSGLNEEELTQWLREFLSELEGNGLISYDTEVWEESI